MLDICWITRRGDLCTSREKEPPQGGRGESRRLVAPTQRVLPSLSQLDEEPLACATLRVNPNSTLGVGSRHRLGAVEKSSRAGFRRINRKSGTPSSPRVLFRDLPRDPDVRFLWGHQDRILERYEQGAETRDLALELPTGTGKTLIGLLIAEWRRRAREERVLYLCPTRQLAHQVGALAARYGIEAEVCLRPNYTGLDLWQGGDVVAVTTYAALFNYNPRFTAPQALVLDDAHAAEDYVASHWTVTIDRSTMADGYRALAALLAPVVDDRTAGLMADEMDYVSDRAAVELVPLPRWWPLASAVREIVEDAVTDTDEWYAWEDHVREGLAACCMLVAWGQVVLRPLIPATSRHPQFANAAQRVYMSATLGAGGELERIFGVRSIDRLPVPEEWEQHSTGRRLFLLPAASLRPKEMEQVVIGAVKSAGRALVLAPTREAVASRRDSLEKGGIPTLTATDIEESLDPFTSREQAALVLANRYDGLDLPGEDCRLLVLDGLPVAVNQLERFLYQRLAATGLLGERMRTRLTQGVGRATRGEGDWCAVLVSSREAFDFCARGEVRELLHPELQGELRFGLDQSRGRKPQDFLDLLAVLLEQGDEWHDADEEIRRLRDEAQRRTDAAAAALQDAVSHEVDFNYAMWGGDYPKALERAIAVADALSGEPAAAYRAWWLYQAGAAAWLAHETFGMSGLLAQARELFRRAAATGRAVHWFAELAYGELGEEANLALAPHDLQVAERVQAFLRSVGFYGGGLGRRSAKLRHRLQDSQSTPWEEGVTQLGKMLGFDATRPGGHNDPDSVWIASAEMAIVWEVKSNEDPTGAVGARTAQQAAGHETWVRSRRSLGENAHVLVLLVSDRERLGDGADIHAANVRVVRLDEVRQLAEQTLGALARIRTLGQTVDDVKLRESALDEFRRAELLPSQLTARLGGRPLSRLPAATQRDLR